MLIITKILIIQLRYDNKIEISYFFHNYFKTNSLLKLLFEVHI